MRENSAVPSQASASVRAMLLSGYRLNPTFGLDGRIVLLLVLLSDRSVTGLIIPFQMCGVSPVRLAIASASPDSAGAMARRMGRPPVC